MTKFAIAGAVLLWITLGMPDSWFVPRKSGYKSIASRARRLR
jgi:hypothetical protein